MQSRNTTSMSELDESKFSVDSEINKSMSLTKKERHLIEVANEILQNSPKEIGFVCRLMVSASLPHSKPSGLIYKRSSNSFTISITGNEQAGGIPYGAYPRLIMTWLASEIVKSNSREIVLGQSLADFMKKLGLQVTGGRWGTIGRFKEQMKRLFSSHIAFTYEDKKAGQWININMSVAEKVHLFWDSKSPDQINLFKSSVLISDAFFNEIKNSPVPIDIRAINVLKDSSLALDIYFWMSYRMSYLKAPTLLTFNNLQMQFGSGYKDTCSGKYEFKRKFLIQLKKVMTIYPAANVIVKENGLLLYPSKTHIQKKLKK